MATTSINATSSWQIALEGPAVVRLQNVSRSTSIEYAVSASTPTGYVGILEELDSDTHCAIPAGQKLWVKTDGTVSKAAAVMIAADSAGNPTSVVGGDGGSYVNATIANGASLSGAVDLGTKRLARINMPSSWTTANLTFQVSADGTNYANLYDATGTEKTVQAAASRAIILDFSEWIGARYIKVRSGTSGTPVNQGAERILQLSTVA